MSWIKILLDAVYVKQGDGRSGTKFEKNGSIRKKFTPSHLRSVLICVVYIQKRFKKVPNKDFVDRILPIYIKLVFDKISIQFFKVHFTL